MRASGAALRIVAAHGRAPYHRVNLRTRPVERLYWAGEHNNNEDEENTMRSFLQWGRQGLKAGSLLAVCGALSACASLGAAPATSAQEPQATSMAEPAKPVFPAAREKSASAEVPAERDSAVSGGFKKQGDKLVEEGGNLVDVAVQPIHDLNLLEKAIPPVLLAAKKNGAYAAPAKTDCESMLAEIRALDLALGPDLDTPSTPSADPTLAEKAVDRAMDYVVQPAVNSVRATVNYFFDGVMPFRSWVRKLSGAEQASAEVASAISAGSTRRPFIKGWFRGAGCVMPPPSVVRISPYALIAPPSEMSEPSAPEPAQTSAASAPAP